MTVSRSFYVGAVLSIPVAALYLLILFLASPPATAQGTTPYVCNSSVVVSTAAAATSELVALTAGQSIRVCSFVLTGGGATTVQFKSGTGTTCGTGTVNRTGALELADNTAIPVGSGVGVIFRGAAGEALCMTNSAAIQVSGVVTYGKS